MAVPFSGLMDAIVATVAVGFLRNRRAPACEVAVHPSAGLAPGDRERASAGGEAARDGLGAAGRGGEGAEAAAGTGPAAGGDEVDPRGRPGGVGDRPRVAARRRGGRAREADVPKSVSGRMLVPPGVSVDGASATHSADATSGAAIRRVFENDPAGREVAELHGHARAGDLDRRRRSCRRRRPSAAPSPDAAGTSSYQAE